MDINTIVKIGIERLYHHPDNPRKDLGDLTELAESIKVNGILQNLTVVPDDVSKTITNFKVVIGNRRLEAAKLAGLTELPCLVTEMTEADQLKTMLMENIQRNDLTVYEQAQGFQMMLDLGGTVESIAKDTGFSTTTVRHRVKLLELDKKKFKKSEAQGATITDYIELEKVEDQDAKNKLLDVIGTADFRSRLNRAIEEQEQKKRIATFAEAASAFAEKIDQADYSKMSHVATHYGYGKEVTAVERPEDTDTVRYFYTVGQYSVTIYKEKPEGETAEAAAERAEQEKAQEERKKKRADLDAASARAYKLRLEFVKGVSTQTAKKHLGDIAAFIIFHGVNNYATISGEDMEELFGSNFDFENENFSLEDAAALVQTPERALLLAAYAIFGDSEEVNYCNSWRPEHEENEALDGLYGLLGKLGYEMSSEEKALQDGTYETFSEAEG